MSEYTIKCCGKEFVTENEFAYKEALSLNDGETPALSERFKYILRLSESIFKIKVSKQTKKAIKRDNSIASLYPLSLEMGKSFLSYEDEEWLDEILGADPYTPLY